MTSGSSTPTVVLVHGAFADASGYAGLIRELQSAGVTVVAPPVPFRSLAPTLPRSARGVGRRRPRAPGRPLVRRCGHHPGVGRLGERAELVYLAAFALDAARASRRPGALRPDPARGQRPPTPYDAVGAAGGPDLYIDPAPSARRSAPTSRPTSPRSWRSASAPWPRPPWARSARQPRGRPPASYLVAAHDRTINPETERFMAVAWAPPPRLFRPRTSGSSAGRSRRPPSSCRPWSDRRPVERRKIVDTHAPAGASVGFGSDPDPPQHAERPGAARAPPVGSASHPGTGPDHRRPATGCGVPLDLPGARGQPSAGRHRDRHPAEVRDDRSAGWADDADGECGDRNARLPVDGPERVRAAVRPSLGRASDRDGTADPTRRGRAGREAATGQAAAC